MSEENAAKIIVGNPNNSTSTPQEEEIMDIVDKQKLLLNIRDYQQQISEINSMICGARSLFSQISNALQRLSSGAEVDSDTHKTITDKYIDVNNAREYLNITTDIKELFKKYDDFVLDKNSIPLEQIIHVKPLIKDRVKLNATEKIIPKFTTLELS